MRSCYGSFTRMRSLATCALVLVLTAAAPPASHLSPLQSVLSAYQRALGSWTPDRPRTEIFRWNVTEGDLTGTEVDVTSGSDYRTDRTLGTSTESEGSLGGRAWSENNNGEVTYESGIHDRIEIDQRAFENALQNPHLAFGNVRLEGVVTQPYDAYLVVVDPPSGVPETLYIDTSTSLLDERVVSYPGHTLTFTYGDYRTTLGLTFPWHVHETIDNGLREVDRRLGDAEIGVPVDPSLIAIPPSRGIVAFTQPTVSLPAKIIGDRIIIAVQLGTHTVNLQLDSGASSIVLDNAIVSALGYSEQGHLTEETAGIYTESDAVVPNMWIGGLGMANVHVASIPFASVAGDEPVAGLLGFDFLDCVVLHIDYADGNVTAIEPQSFIPPPDAVALPIALDDNIPAVLVSLGGVSPIRMLVDTGADRSLLFSSFATEHPSALVDQGLGAEMEAQSPFLGTFEGVGGSIEYRPIDLGPLRVAAWSFPHWLFQLTQDPSKFEIEDYDGILGQDFLRYYDLYLDYPHDRILLVPNARYTERFGT